MKISIVILVLSVFVNAASADPEPDVIGIYFQPEAYSFCAPVAPSTPFTVYIVILDPSSPEVAGAEFSFCVGAASTMSPFYFLLAAHWSAECPMPIDISVLDPCEAGIRVMCTEPIPATGQNVVVAEFRGMVLANTPLYFFLGPHSIPTVDDGLPAYVGVGGQNVPLTCASGDCGSPVANVNGECGVAAEPTTFGSLKSLYR